MCFGSCKNEIMSGPDRGECGGGDCPVDNCVSCGVSVDGDSLCEECKETMEEN